MQIGGDFGKFRQTSNSNRSRLRVVSNFGDGDCGADEIHTRAQNFASRLLELLRARVYFARPTIYSQSRSLNRREVAMKSYTTGPRPLHGKQSKEWLLGTINKINMATKSAFNLTAIALSSRLVPISRRFVYLPLKHCQLTRRYSSIKEETSPQNHEDSQELKLSDGCVKVRTIKLN